MCLYQTEEKPAHLHLAFTADNRQQVDAFHRVALASFYSEDAVNHQVAEAPVQGREAIRQMGQAELPSSTRLACGYGMKQFFEQTSVGFTHSERLTVKEGGRPGSSLRPKCQRRHRLPPPAGELKLLEGTPTLVTDAGETRLGPGMCAGFKAGEGVGTSSSIGAMGSWSTLRLATALPENVFCIQMMISRRYSRAVVGAFAARTVSRSDVSRLGPSPRGNFEV